MGLFSNKILVFFLVGGFFLCTTQGNNIHYYDFVVSEANFTRLCCEKSMLVVNGSFPGPVIRARQGDTVYINVHNEGNYGFTIHWHGVKQPRNPWSDGPQFITQCPIQPGTNFTYEVEFSKEEGTLWWHAHSEWTRASVHGAIVVLPAENKTYPFPEPDGEEVVVLASWYKGDINEEVFEDLITGADVPKSNSYTINGQPGDLIECSKESTYHWEVEYGKTYLLRVVSAVMNAELFFAIAQHTLTVVGMDAAYVKPIVTDYVMISPGQSMDILVTANQSLSNYYMAARQYYNIGAPGDEYDQTNVTAILYYAGNYTAPDSPIFPTTTLPSYEDDDAAVIFRASIRSLANKYYPVDVPTNISTRMFITASMNSAFVSDDNSSSNSLGLAASLNNVSWKNPSTNVLLAYYMNISGLYNADFPNQPPSLYDFISDNITAGSKTTKATRVKMLEYNEEVEIVVQGTNMLTQAEDHPMHIHGHSFYVVGMGYGNFDNVSDPLTYNLDDPPELNTVSVPNKGWAAVRFKANNPGVWLWHCHLDKHLTFGMEVVFIVKNGETEETSIRPPPSYMPACDSSLIVQLHTTDEAYNI